MLGVDLAARLNGLDFKVIRAGGVFVSRAGNGVFGLDYLDHYSTFLQVSRWDSSSRHPQTTGFPGLMGLEGSVQRQTRTRTLIRTKNHRVSCLVRIYDLLLSKTLRKTHRNVHTRFLAWLVLGSPYQLSCITDV